MGSANIDVKYDVVPFDGTPGIEYDNFERRLLDISSGRGDDRGYSLADNLLGVDEGSPTDRATDRRDPCYPAESTSIIQETSKGTPRLASARGQEPSPSPPT